MDTVTNEEILLYIAVVFEEYLTAAHEKDAHDPELVMHRERLKGAARMAEELLNIPINMYADGRLSFEIVPPADREHLRIKL